MRSKRSSYTLGVVELRQLSRRKGELVVLDFKVSLSARIGFQSIFVIHNFSRSQISL